MSSVLIQDLYRPFAQRRAKLSGLLLGGMAILCFYWQQYSDLPLLQFALGVMVFSYSGLLGVYFTSLFTNRGNQRSVLAALLGGFVVTLLFQPYIMTLYLPSDWQFNLGFMWQLCVGSLVATLLCMLGKPRTMANQAEICHGVG